MSPGVSTVGVRQASELLGVSEATIRNWIGSGRLAAERGPQPQRPRWSVWVDAKGQPVDPDGNVVVSARPIADSLAARVSQLERKVGQASASTGSENFRDAALQLQAAMERQRRALELQMEAFSELNAALSEQAAVITGLLIGDPIAGVAAHS